MTDFTHITWPPAYVIKKHPRARYVKLRAVRSNELEITVPNRFNIKDIHAILEANKSWIIKQLSQIAPPLLAQLPNEVTIQMINETWSVEYIACRAKCEIIERPNHEIVLIGNIDDKMKCKAMLVTWLKNQAKMYLMPLLQSLSDITQLKFATVSIRDQQTLWGSCTAKKSISLNYKLIFLPMHLVKHVMIHELCHTKCLNHSEKFWRLVAMHDDAWQSHKLALRKADRFIPDWIKHDHKCMAN